MSNWSKMSKNSKVKIIIMVVLTPILLFIIYGTDLVAPKAEYVRLTNGKEFHNVSFRQTSDFDVYIDGEYYTKFDIDSLAW